MFQLITTILEACHGAADLYRRFLLLTALINGMIVMIVIMPVP